MKERHDRPDIIDNQKNTVASILNLNIPKIKQLDISTGYFDVAGYGKIRETLDPAVQKNMEFRLLMGRDALLSKTNDFEEYARIYREGGAGRCRQVIPDEPRSSPRRVCIMDRGPRKKVRDRR